ncbi:hypothetical protein [Novosphingobium sp. EMRT-2]|uniref:hypothetical protein n=1 Tax=Novosphingobium sp. EMRT-2 TaxID=2571749 RepID=UPI0010BDD4AF|nr:hypothetical protein [Novosphingobium sp. EMRT-2]QCI93450.1 hypothetical protein FA702_07670 [Novosphingobium sp. EMRT-2]
MPQLSSVTCYFVNPIVGTVREDDRTASWTLTEVTFAFLSGDQAQPTDGLVFNCHHALRDQDGNPVPSEILALLDLEQGLRDAFKREFGAAWAAIDAG